MERLEALMTVSCVSFFSRGGGGNEQVKCAMYASKGISQLDHSLIKG